MRPSACRARCWFSPIRASPSARSRCNNRTKAIHRLHRFSWLHCRWSSSCLDNRRNLWMVLLLPRVQIKKPAHDEQDDRFHKHEEAQAKLAVFIERVRIGDIRPHNQPAEDPDHLSFSVPATQQVIWTLGGLIMG